MEEDEGKPKIYVAESDVIDQRAKDALLILGDNNNDVYVDLARMRAESENPKNPLRGQQGSTLRWINQKMISSPIYEEGDDSKRVVGIKMKRGGRVLFGAAPEEGTIYVTDDASRISEHLESGREWDYPAFLRYSAEPLHSGLLKMEYGGDKDPKKLELEDLTEGLEIPSLGPHQFVLVNDNTLYAVEQKVTETARGSHRFRLVGEPTARQIPYDFPIDCVIPGFKPRGLEQRIAFHQLTHPDTEVCVVSGGASSGKTVITYVAALQMVLGNEKRRKQGELKRQIRVYMPDDLVGGKDRGIGFLKGDFDEKTAHIYEAWKDTHDELGLGQHLHFDSLFMDPNSPVGVKELFDSGKGVKQQVVRSGDENLHLPSRNATIKKGHLPFEKGRTHSNVVMAADEVQDYTPEEAWMLTTRGGPGTKLFLFGDPYAQVKNPKLSRDLNGLVYIANRLKEERHPRASFIHLGGSHRNQTSELIGSKSPPRVG